MVEDTDVGAPGTTAVTAPDVTAIRTNVPEEFTAVALTPMW